MDDRFSWNFSNDVIFTDSTGDRIDGFSKHKITYNQVLTVGDYVTLKGDSRVYVIEEVGQPINGEIQYFARKITELPGQKLMRYFYQSDIDKKIDASNDKQYIK